MRVFWLCDFDPAGDSMPVAMARQLEYWGQDAGLDIKLHHLLLTREQCQEYRLPRTPIKETDRRRTGWETRYGQGATELDALDALHPGELARIVTEAIEPYVDLELQEKLYQAREEAQEQVDAEWQELTGEDQQQLDEISQQAEQIAESYQERLGQLSDELHKDMQPLQDKLNLVWQAIREKSYGMDAHLVDRPEAEADGIDEDDWLFDNSRDYIKQLKYYKSHKEAC